MNGGDIPRRALQPEKWIPTPDGMEKEQSELFIPKSSGPNLLMGAAAILPKNLVIGGVL